MVPNEAAQYDGIVQLLSYFSWTWVGLIVSDDNQGEEFVQSLKSVLSRNSICVAFTEKAPFFFPQTVNGLTYYEFSSVTVLKNLIFTKANVIVAYGVTSLMIGLNILLRSYEQSTRKSTEKVWVTTAQWDFSSKVFLNDWHVKHFHGSLSFTVHKNNVPRFKTFLQEFNPYQHRDSNFFQYFWHDAFDCISPNFYKNTQNFKICTGEEKLESLPQTVFEMNMSGDSYSIYNAVYALAYALDNLYSSENPKPSHHPLQKINFNNSAGEEVFFNDNMELSTGYDLVNWVVFPNKSFMKVSIGAIDSKTSSDQRFTIKKDAITWPNIFNQTVPESTCTERCHPGYYMKILEGQPSCCYHCLGCPEGTISNQTNAHHCYKCPEEECPNKKRNRCVPKVITFLTYDGPLGICLVSAAVFLSLLTASVFGIFIRHRNTPIVKATNRDLTYRLLISIFLCFLCSLIFIGQPSTVTCLLRQVAFGNIFTFALSCVLAKTITVVIAFIATNPGGKIIKWVGKKLSNYIIFFCSAIQAGICAIWLGTSPPFPDKVSQSAEIVAQCNEGSSTMFYIVLGYLGFLASVSFTLAYLTRKLPDTFNEAKFITFSMLVFCSVWISFIPTYLSTKGKYMVAVEIFSILASGVGLLSFIFAPKVYIILLKPNMNIKDHLFKKGKSIK
uniref:G-protein coupled receptors family 3 profile domain-containing protein n=2 Tax=Anolis carolinensis TaxID=28377 RepID=A0A803T307_ANOCA